MYCKCKTCESYVPVSDEVGTLTIVPCNGSCDFDVTFYHVQSYRKNDGTIIKEYTTDEERIL